MNRQSNLSWSIENEAVIRVAFDIDGTGKYHVDTGHRTLNHFVETFARYGRFNIELSVEGDGVTHHLFEQTGKALGLGIASAIGNRDELKQIARSTVPMDGSLADIAIDINAGCGRFDYQICYNLFDKTAYLDGVDLFSYFHLLEKLSYNAQVNTHLIILNADDNHHAIEALYKSVSIAIHEASRKVDSPIIRLAKKIAILE